MTKSLWVRWLVLAGLLGFCAMALTAGQDNSKIGTFPTANVGWETNMRNMVRFTTTTSAANTVFCVSTMTVGSLTYSTTTYGGSFSPSAALATSTSTTYGGRGYMTLQIVGAASNVSVDLNAVDISTNTSPYLTQGQWFSPDDPIVWQGSVCLMSPSTFTATGWMFFERPRG
jgi:hypothetical protein